jgi:hypothetical protein
MLTLAQAAAMTGMNRSSILRAIKRGAITGTKDHNEVWHVDGAELARAFPVTPPNTQPKQQDAHTDALVALRADNAPSPESAPYTAIAEALPANVAVEIDRDAGVVNFRA